MFQLISRIPNHASVKNIIFDFGNVICDLDISRTQEKFKEFGPARSSSHLSAEEQSHRFQKLVEDYETSAITSQEFRDAIRNHYLVPPTDEAIDDTWNALLVGIPERRVRLLENIRDRYRIFLLSNSNEIHYNHYVQDFRDKYGYRDFDSLFEKAYFSFRLHMKKPDPEIFTFILSDSLMNPEETLFIDDTLVHVEAARECQINGYHLKDGEDIVNLFRDDTSVAKGEVR